MKKINTNLLKSIVYCTALLPSYSFANESINAIPIRKTLKEDSSISFKLSGKSIERKKLTFTIEKYPSFGVLVLKGNTAKYKPNRDYFGMDNFQYKVSDGVNASSPANVELIITPVNDVPVAQPQKLTISNTLTKISLVATDIENDPLTYRIISKPKKGKATLSGNIVNYVLNKADFKGNDSFSFAVNDGKKTSKTAAVSLSITGSNQVVCIPPQFLLENTGCVTPYITNVSPLNGPTNTNVSITVTGANLPSNMVLGIDGQSANCMVYKQTISEATFGCPLDKTGIWDLILQSDSTLKGGVKIASSFASFTVSKEIQQGMKALNDTGITTCTTHRANSTQGCPMPGYYGQDADYGRDATNNDNTDGHAGFSFTKLDDKGNSLPNDATQWSCIRDNVTGLIWEIKSHVGGLHYKFNTYTWYNPDVAINRQGVQNGGNCMGSTCDTFSFVQEVNSQNFCGANNWRIPEVDELMSIVDNSGYNPTIDVNYFPNTVTVNFVDNQDSDLPIIDDEHPFFTAEFWANTADLALSNMQFVNFTRGGNTHGYKGDPRLIRLVHN